MTDDQAARLEAAGFRRTAIKTGRQYVLWEKGGRLHSLETALATLNQSSPPIKEATVPAPRREKEPEPERVKLLEGVSIVAEGWGGLLNVPAWTYTKGRYAVKSVYTIAGPVSPPVRLAVRYDRGSRSAQASALELYRSIVSWGYSSVTLEHAP